MFLQCLGLQCDGEPFYNCVFGGSLMHSCEETGASMSFFTEGHQLKILTLRMHGLLFLVLPAGLLQLQGQEWDNSRKVFTPIRISLKIKGVVTFGALLELCTIFGVCNITLGLLSRQSFLKATSATRWGLWPTLQHFFKFSSKSRGTNPWLLSCCT